MTTATAALRADPLAHDFLAEVPKRAPSMPLSHRIGASFAGARDGRRGLPELPAQGSLTFETFWLSRNKESFAEADHRSLLRIEARVAPVARDLARVVATRDQLILDREAARVKLSELRSRPRPDISTVMRRPGEKNAPDTVVVARRQRLWDTPVSAASANLARLDSRIAELESEAAALAALIATAFGGAVTRSADLRAFYSRRANVYARALTRTHEHGPRFSSLIASTDIPAPAWTTSSCPWIPITYNPEVQN